VSNKRVIFYRGITKGIMVIFTQLLLFDSVKQGGCRLILLRCLSEFLSEFNVMLSTRKNHVPVSFVTTYFIVGHVGATMMTDQRIWDLSVMDGGVNIPIPLSLQSM
jgi:uncharacterized membrane protein